jgi:hypothetical protein
MRRVPEGQAVPGDGGLARRPWIVVRPGSSRLGRGAAFDAHRRGTQLLPSILSLRFTAAQAMRCALGSSSPRRAGQALLKAAR